MLTTLQHKQIYKTLEKELLKPHLQALGFRKSGKVFYQVKEDLAIELKVMFSRFNTGYNFSFHIQLMIWVGNMEGIKQPKELLSQGRAAGFYRRNLSFLRGKENEVYVIDPEKPEEPEQLLEKDVSVYFPAFLEKNSSAEQLVSNMLNERRILEYGNLIGALVQLGRQEEASEYLQSLSLPEEQKQLTAKVYGLNLD